MKKVSRDIEEKVIALYQTGASMKVTGLEYGISAATVKRILDENNIVKRTKGGIYKLNDEEIIKKYKSGLSSTIIAEEYDVTVHTITNILEKHNIARSNIYHNLSLIEDYWEKIDTIDKAYYLGFLLTDGNVIGNQVKLELKSDDIDILKIFSKYTKNENKIFIIDRHEKGKFAAFQVKRHKWVEDLAKHHIIPNKTYVAEFPEDVPENLMSHFIRGLIDGDGWISYKSHAIGFCGSEKCVTQLHDYLVKKLDVFNVKILQTEAHLWQIVWSSKKDIQKIGKYIYKDKKDCYLNRKYNNYLNIIQANTEITY